LWGWDSCGGGGGDVKENSLKNNMKSKTVVVLAVCLCLFIMMATAVFADTIITNSSSFNVDLNNGAYITQSTAPSNWFNQELLTSGDETKTGTTMFSAIPYFSFENTRYFQFVYDMQEIGGASGGGVGGRQLNIDDIVISVVGLGTIWTLDKSTYGSIILNSVSPNFTTTPLGAGGDMALYVPVSLFTGYGLTGSNQLTLTVTQSQSDNGTDEWVVLGSAGGGSYFGPNEPITNPVPLPSSVLLLGSGLLGLGLLGYRRKRS
jgi:hypothetical protein